jgi:hypothetical protein
VLLLLLLLLLLVLVLPAGSDTTWPFLMPSG